MSVRPGSTWQLVRQLLIEQALLVITGGAVGAIVGAATLSALVALAPRNVPRLDEVTLDRAVLLGTAGVSCVSAFLFGIVPALRASGVRGQETPPSRRPRRDAFHVPPPARADDR
jgi:ABC-type antimicrobial peptide transport system permease subunit